MADKGFQQWARDGRLATVALIVVFLTWLAFQFFVEPIDRPSLLDQMLWTIMGGWLTNIAFVATRSNGKDDRKDDE